MRQQKPAESSLRNLEEEVALAAGSSDADEKDLATAKDDRRIVAIASGALN